MRHLILRQLIRSAASSLLVLFVASSALAEAPAAAPAPAGEGVQPVSPAALRQARRQRHLKHRTLKEVIGTIDPNVDVTVSAGDEPLRAGIGYNYSVKPAYQSGLYTRTDRWHSNVDLKLIPGLKASPEGEIVVLRQFKTKREALLAKPQTKLTQLPFTADRALEMDPGSIILVPVRFEALEGIEGSTSLAGPLSIGGHIGHVDRGTYQIQAQRLEGSKVRLRVFATRQHALEAQGDLGLGVSGVKTNLASVSLDKGTKHLASAEYVFDLADARARKAYDSMFREGRLRPRVKYVNPFVKAKEVGEDLRAGVAEVHALSQSDLELPTASRPVAQAYQTQSDSKSTDKSGRFNLLGAAGFRRSTSYSPEAHLSFEDENGVHHDTVASSFETSKGVKLLFGLRNEEQIRRASLIAKTDADGKPTGIGEYVVSLELKDKRMGKSETEKALVKLKRLVAPSILLKLQVTPLLTATAYKNARVYTQVVFTQEAMTSLQGLTADQIEESLTAYLAKMDDPFADHKRAIRKAAELLSRSLDPRLDSAQRMKLFADLQRENLFRDLGSGYLMSLLPQDRLEDLVSVYVRIDATAFSNTVVAKFGHSDFTNITKVTECAAYEQNRTEIDLRLEDVCANLNDNAPVGPQVAAPMAASAAAGAIQ